MSSPTAIIKQLEHPGWVERLRERWPDGLRLALAAVLSAAISQALHLPETYWAVLSALVVGRPQAGGTRQAGRTRLIGTVIGSLVGLLVINERIWHPPEILILASAMIPLALFITLFEEYRTAPVAAIIMLSSAGSIASPIHIALLRLLEITIGSLTSMAVSMLVVPSHTHRSHLRMGTALAARFASLLRQYFAADVDRARWDADYDQLRRDLRELAVLVRSKNTSKEHSVQGLRMLKWVNRIQADVAFVARISPALAGTDELRPSLAAARRYAEEFERACCVLAAAASGKVSLQELQSRVPALSAALETLPQQHPLVTTLHFMLHTLTQDFLGLMKVLDLSSLRLAPGT
jgi:uncharacterized membrane protein YccC